MAGSARLTCGILVALAVLGTAAAADGYPRPTTVYVWESTRPPDVGISKTGWHKPKVSRLRAGLYAVHVSEPHPDAFLILRGPGVNRRTTMAFFGVKHWLVRFRPGTYELIVLADVYGVVLRAPNDWKFT